MGGRQQRGRPDIRAATLSDTTGDVAMAVARRRTAHAPISRTTARGAWAAGRGLTPPGRLERSNAHVARCGGRLTTTRFACARRRRSAGGAGVRRAPLSRFQSRRRTMASPPHPAARRGAFQSSSATCACRHGRTHAAANVRRHWRITSHQVTGEAQLQHAVDSLNSGSSFASSSSRDGPNAEQAILAGATSGVARVEQDLRSTPARQHRGLMDVLAIVQRRRRSPTDWNLAEHLAGDPSCDPWRVVTSAR